MGTNRLMRTGRHVFKIFPSQVHCKLCASPLQGGWASVMSVIGKGPWEKNPKYCAMCFKDMVKHRAGAEIPCSLLFADVRGSTELAEQTSPTEFRRQMNQFFAVATDVLVDHDAIVDKFVGDEVIGLFIPVLTGELHASRAIEAGRALLASVRRDGSRSGPASTRASPSSARSAPMTWPSSRPWAIPSTWRRVWRPPLEPMSYW